MLYYVDELINNGERKRESNHMLHGSPCITELRLKEYLTVTLAGGLGSPKMAESELL